MATTDVDMHDGEAANSRSSSGFTLVELIVTLVIMGALAVVSAPLFFGAEGFRQSGFFNETISVVRYAQKLAIASGCTVRVVTTSSSVSLQRAASAGVCTTGPYATAVTDPSNPGNAYTRTAPSGVSLSVADFIFNPAGVASATVTITVSGASTSSQFQVVAATGFVRRL